MAGMSGVEADRDRLKRENEQLRAAIRNQAGDNLCWLKELPIQIPPEREFLESCARYHFQIANQNGILTGSKTIAQLEAQVARLQAMYNSLRRGSDTKNINSIFDEEETIG